MSNLIKKEDVANWMFENRMCTSIHNAYDKLKELPMLDLADHDKRIKNEVIDEMVSNLIRNSRTEIIDDKIQLIVTEDRIKLIAEKMKGNQNE